jgi:hypothetical protein
MLLGKLWHPKDLPSPFSRLLFSGWLRETAQNDEKRGKECEFQLFSGINPGATMPEHSPAAKKFGGRSKHLTSA